MARRAPQRRRSSAPRIMLVCEGQTEVGYFKYIAQRLRSSGISVKAVHDAVSPMAIVKNAYAYIDGDPKRGIEANQYDQVWAVFDWDEHTKEVREAISWAEQRGIRIALSNPCFDTWLIWHFDDYMRVGCHAKDTDTKLHALWSSYRKGANNKWEDLGNGLHDASERARKAEQRFARDGIDFPDDRPTSQVLTLMDSITEGWVAAGKPRDSCPVG